MSARSTLRALRRLATWRKALLICGGLLFIALSVARLLRPRYPAFTCQADACRPVAAPRGPATGPFRAGEIDLTGDGVAERVERVDGRVMVYAGGAEVWRSPAEWRVVDAALGDPDDDGRNEMLLALWKPDETGAPRSHPFIIGYRGGIYRITWGGSAVVAPIHEVELGDVDGDGAQELIVLEEEGAALAVGVWNWHGWGFTRAWRSAAGDYRDLTLLPGEAGGEARVIRARVTP